MKAQQHECERKTQEKPIARVLPKTQEKQARNQKACGHPKRVSNPHHFPVATGEKARAILGQMRRGDMLINHTLGINQAASTTGRAKLGPDFVAALAKCGL